MENDPESLYLIEILMRQLNTIQQMKNELLENFTEGKFTVIKQQEEGFSQQINDLSDRIKKLGHIL